MKRGNVNEDFGKVKTGTSVEPVHINTAIMQPYWTDWSRDTQLKETQTDLDCGDVSSHVGGLMFAFRPEDNGVCPSCLTVFDQLFVLEERLQCSSDAKD